MNINKKLAANSNIKHYPSFASPKDGPPTSLTSKSFFIPRVSIRAIDASVIPTSYAATYRIILGINETKEDLWSYFLEKTRDNLHIVLAMSPAGDSLRIRCRNFPGLVNNSGINWFFSWPPEALVSVAKSDPCKGFY